MLSRTRSAIRSAASGRPTPLTKSEARGVSYPASFRDFRAQVIADRRRGHVFHKSTVDPGLVSLACPARDHDTMPVAAVTVIVPENLSETFGGEQALHPLVARRGDLQEARLSRLTRAATARHHQMHKQCACTLAASNYDDRTGGRPCRPH